MKRSFDTSEPVRLLVQIGAGTVAVTATDTDHVHVEVSGPAADDIVVEQDDDLIRVTEPDRLGWILRHSRALQVRVLVPAGSSLTTRLGSAALHTEGLLGACTLASGSGDVQIDSTGELDSTTGSGRLQVRRVTGDVRSKSGSGDVTVAQVTGDADVISGSADVRLDDVDGSVRVRTGSGRVVLGTVGADVSTMTGSGDVEVGHARRGRVACRAASGDVRVTVAHGIPTWADLHSVSGRISHGLQSLGAPAEGQDRVELRVTTVSGDIRVQHAVLV